MSKLYGEYGLLSSYNLCVSSTPVRKRYNDGKFMTTML